MDLRQRLEGLPQELYDEIFKLTFTYTPAKDGRRAFASRWSVKEILLPSLPRLLHVSRNTRKTFAKSYYGDPAGFVLPEIDTDDLHRWLVLLPKQHRDLLQKVKIYVQWDLLYNLILFTLPLGSDIEHDSVWDRIVVELDDADD